MIIKTKPVPPCKKNGVNCPNRYSNCHSTCREYLCFVRDNKIWREQQYHTNRIVQALKEAEYRRSEICKEKRSKRR